jgi:hypothetical protein
VRVALDASRWTAFGLVLMDFASAAVASPGELSELRNFGAPVLMMCTAPRGRTVATHGEIESVVWSPFDLSTLTGAVCRFLAPSSDRPARVDDGPQPKSSGTFAATYSRDDSEISTIPSPPEPGSEAERLSLEALGALVLEATRGRRD